MKFNSSYWIFIGLILGFLGILYLPNSWLTKSVLTIVVISGAVMSKVGVGDSHSEKEPKRVSAEEVLASMTPVDSLPAVDGRRKFGKQVSAPCVLARLLPDGALLEHGEIALYDFQSGEWVVFPKADRKIYFTATHYRIAG